MAYYPPDKLSAIILDWAGVTVDFGSRAPVLAMLAAFDHQEVSVTEQEVRSHMGKAKREHLAAILQTPRVNEAWRKVHGQVPREAELSRIYESFLSLQQECIGAHSDLIPGCTEAIQACRDRGLKIGSSTGYTRELLAPAAANAKAGGYEPDAVVCASDVSPGRPAPWLIFENAHRLNVYPIAAVLKVDDTPAGVTAGRNAGAWAIGVVESGNEIGLSAAEWYALPPEDQQERRCAAGERLTRAGAHLLIDTIAELPGAIERINTRLTNGESPC